MLIYCNRPTESAVDPSYITFKDNLAQYKGEFIYLVTGHCQTFERSDKYLWLSIDDSLKSVVNSIEIRYKEMQCESQEDYYKISWNTRPSLYLSPSDKLSPSMLRVSTLNAETFGEYSPGGLARVVLTLGYDRHGLVWNAVKIQYIEQGSDIFQECKL